MASTVVPSRGERNVAWIENYCRVPSGMNAGKPVELRDWQKDCIKAIYDNPNATRRAILSFGRKNGKTAISAWLMLLHLCGPEAVQNGELCSSAMSREQAGILYKLARATVLQSPDLKSEITIKDTAKKLECRDLGTVYEALSKDASTAVGRSPVFLIHDELGQVRGPRYELFENLESGMGAHENPLSIIISTQAPNPTDLLSVLIDDALADADPRTVLCLYTAPIEADPFAEETIKLANPAYGDFQNAKETMAQAKAAERMPSAQAAFRNLHLNQRVEMDSAFVSIDVWRRNSTVPLPLDGIVFGGLDLSTSNDLTALVYGQWAESKFQVEPHFWLPKEVLDERSRTQKQPYTLWAEQGYLHTTPSKSIDFDFIAHRLFEDSKNLNFGRINYDRAYWPSLRGALIRAGFTEGQVEGDRAIFQPHGQGFMSMSPALLDLEADLIEGRVAHGNHPVLNMCAINSRVTFDPAGNRKLDKQKATGKIDGMVALMMARAAAGSHHEKKKAAAKFFTLSR
ncbi:terminase large subunit [Aureimonas altamirensis]|uniref:terminase large subunit n=1 Tax=Aureimonas altamirensis TaxID=370622 RepID=UPI002036E6B7|nr:terminase TerL endonuclease subunit [Aureimonas altamirensis]MCM2503904.1 terminase large subunit [Aureimonas altamirensis]